MKASIFAILLLLVPITSSVVAKRGTKSFRSYSKQGTSRQLFMIDSTNKSEYNADDYKDRLWRDARGEFRNKHDDFMMPRKQAKKQKFGKKQNGGDGPIRDWVPTISWSTSEPITQPTSMSSSSPTRYYSDTASSVPTVGATTETIMSTESLASPSPSVPPTRFPLTILITGAPLALPSSAPALSSSSGPSIVSSSTSPTIVNSGPSSFPSSTWSIHPTSTSQGPSTMSPSESPSHHPTMMVSGSSNPSSGVPLGLPSQVPSDLPSQIPSGTLPLLSLNPSESLSHLPTEMPSDGPSTIPSDTPSLVPSSSIFMNPSMLPTDSIGAPTDSPSMARNTTPLPSLAPTTANTNHASTSSSLVHRSLLSFELTLEPKWPNVTIDDSAFLIVGAMSSFLFAELRTLWRTSTHLESISLATKELEDRRDLVGLRIHSRALLQSNDTAWILVIPSGRASFSGPLIPTQMQVEESQRDVLVRNNTLELLQKHFEEWDIDWVIQDLRLSSVMKEEPSSKTSALGESSSNQANASSSVPKEVSTVLVPIAAVGLLLMISIGLWKGATRRKLRHKPPLGSFPSSFHDHSIKTSDPSTVIVIHSIHPEANSSSFASLSNHDHCAMDNANEGGEEDDDNEIEISFMYSKDNNKNDQHQLETILFDQLDDFVWEISSSSSSCFQDDQDESSMNDDHGTKETKEETTTLLSEPSSNQSFRTALQFEEAEVLASRHEQKVGCATTEPVTRAKNENVTCAPYPQSSPPKEEGPREKEVEEAQQAPSSTLTSPSSAMANFLTWESLVEASFFASDASSPEKDSIYNQERV